ncbi:hypothetical protein AB5J55_43105 [Streptomyces sp. R11]|uniref:Uncharacterized protein n=1 Tax=Streptomyces sp. R11 TaxID=3238625 RepID=A0AB39NGC0_9ACTN
MAKEDRMTLVAYKIPLFLGLEIIKRCSWPRYVLSGPTTVHGAIAAEGEKITIGGGAWLPRVQSRRGPGRNRSAGTGESADPAMASGEAEA